MNRARILTLLLGLYQLLTGLPYFFPEFGEINKVIPYMALVVGLLIVVAHPDSSIFLGWLMAAAILILTGLDVILDLQFSMLGLIISSLQIVAGVLILIGLTDISHNVGVLIFCVWLILSGFSAFLGFGSENILLAGFSIASGVLMLINV